MDWSTSRVLSQTVERANEIDLEVELLPAWYDVDDAATLGRLCDELFAHDNTSGAQNDLGRHEAPHTTEYLARLLKAEGRQRLWPGNRSISLRK